MHPNPKAALVVGFGAGVTAGFVRGSSGHQTHRHLRTGKTDSPAATQYFRAENYNVLNDPRTTITYDDARHFLLTMKDKYDIITSDPIHPWVKGTSTLYSKEYFELCASAT